MVRTPAHLIDEIGGPSAVAEKLNMKAATVRMWSFRNAIPRSAWPEIIKTFRGVTFDALIQSELSSGRAMRAENSVRSEGA